MAWTAPRTWTDGELVTASIMNTHVRDNLNTVPHLLAIKSADETVNNSNVFQNDDHLFFSVGANEVWWFRGVLMVDSTTTADFKVTMTVPASATLRLGYTSSLDSGWASWSANSSATTATALVGGGTTAGTAGMAGSGSIVGVDIMGMVIVSSTAGTAQLQWAQATAGATNTIVKQHSFLMGMKVA